MGSLREICTVFVSGDKMVYVAECYAEEHIGIIQLQELGFWWIDELYYRQVFMFLKSIKGILPLNG
ncbi:MAG: hypothetical protein ACTSXX_05250 [Candidatus Baldrarchaeia archaeon]